MNPWVRCQPLTRLQRIRIDLDFGFLKNRRPRRVVPVTFDQAGLTSSPISGGE